MEPKQGKEGNYTELYGSNSKSGYIKGNDQIIVLGWESGSSEKGVTNMQRETMTKNDNDNTNKKMLIMISSEK